MKKPINHIYLIILLAILSAVAPVAVDTYIPSIPSMANDFQVGIEQIELTLAIFLIGFAIGQIFGGVLLIVWDEEKALLLDYWALHFLVLLSFLVLILLNYGYIDLLRLFLVGLLWLMPVLLFVIYFMGHKQPKSFHSLEPYAV